MLRAVERPAWGFGDGEAQRDDAAGGGSGHQIEQARHRFTRAPLDFGEQHGRKDAANPAAINGQDPHHVSYGDRTPDARTIRGARLSKRHARRQKQNASRGDPRYWDTGKVVVLVATPFWLMITVRLPVRALVGMSKSIWYRPAKPGVSPAKST